MSENKVIEVDEEISKSDIKLQQFKEHQETVDRAIKLLKNEFIKELTDISKYLKYKIRRENIGDAKTMHNANIVTIKLAYLYYVLDDLKAYKYFKEYNNHPLVIKSVNNAINLIDNKEVTSFIKKVNKTIYSTLFSIPENIKQDALKQVACGKCKSKLLKEIHIRHLLLRPVMAVICQACGAESFIEFGKEEDS